MGADQWDDSNPAFPHWRAPDVTVGMIDLRGLPGQSLAGVLGNKPFGFFAVSGTLPSEYTLVGSGDLREISSTARMKSAWLSLLGYEPNGDTLNDLLYNHMTAGSDPTFQDPTPPLMPTISGMLDIHLGGHSLIKRERFRYGDHPHTNKVQAVLYRNYRAMRVDVEAGRMGDGHERRVLDKWREKYNLQRDDWKLLIPQELRNGHPGLLPHQTTITDDFNRANEALGASADWTELASTTNVVNNAIDTSNNNTVGRNDNDLSSDDHYSQLDLTAQSSNTDDPGTLARMRSDATATYYMGRQQIDTGLHEFHKRISGTFTLLDSVAGTGPTLPTTQRVDCDGSTMKFTVDSVEKLNFTDTAITGNLRCGFRSNSLGGLNTHDDFEAADLAAGGIQVLRQRRE